jgi:hypothetical protein
MARSLVTIDLGALRRNAERLLRVLDGAERWAVVKADGTIAAQSGGITLTGKPTVGTYILDFGAAVTSKLILVSSANAGYTGDRGTVSGGPCGGTPDGSICPAANDANHVRVITRKEGDSVAEDHPFYVAVIG